MAAAFLSLCYLLTSHHTSQSVLRYFAIDMQLRVICDVTQARFVDLISQTPSENCLLNFTLNKKLTVKSRIFPVNYTDCYTAVTNFL